MGEFRGASGVFALVGLGGGGLWLWDINGDYDVLLRGVAMEPLCIVICSSVSSCFGSLMRVLWRSVGTGTRDPD